MNSLPLIHHHLFVAAIGNGDRAYPPAAPVEEPLVDLAVRRSLLECEVVDASQPLPAHPVHPLRTSIRPAGA